MKIFLLAYSCEPNRGSEPGIGWKWALELAKDSSKDVFVLTRSNNKTVIEDYWLQNKQPQNLHYFYLELGDIWLWLKHHGMSVNLYYALWLKKASDYSVKLNEQYNFDVAHHITFGVFRDACMLYKLGIPYVLGPLGGGDYTPRKLMCLYSLRGRTYEALRKIANRLSLFNPFLVQTFDNASLILTKTSDTKRLLSRWKNKIEVKLEIGINNVNNPSSIEREQQFLYVGRFIELKGIALMLPAFLQYNMKHPNSKLVLIGEGPLRSYILKFKEKHHLEDAITILPWMQQEQLQSFYQKSTALVFPSLHDSSGNVVLEALANALPVICLDCGGPASIKGEKLNQLTISTDGKDANRIIDDIAYNMAKISDNEDFYMTESQQSLNRAKDFVWSTTVNTLYDKIENLLIQK